MRNCADAKRPEKSPITTKSTIIIAESPFVRLKSFCFSKAPIPTFYLARPRTPICGTSLFQTCRQVPCNAPIQVTVRRQHAACFCRGTLPSGVHQSVPSSQENLAGHLIPLQAGAGPYVTTCEVFHRAHGLSRLVGCGEPVGLIKEGKYPVAVTSHGITAPLTHAYMSRR